MTPPQSCEGAPARRYTRPSRSRQLGIRPGSVSSRRVRYRGVPRQRRCARRGELLVDAPSFTLTQSVVAHDARIGQQAKKAHLGNPAERRAALPDRREPVAGESVMEMPVGRQRYPNVDIRQGDLRCRHWLDAGPPDAWNGRGEVGLVGDERFACPPPPVAAPPERTPLDLSLSSPPQT